MPAFLFTDVESSTRLWEQHPEDMRGALGLHDSILRESVELVGGAVVKSTGDGVMAVFDEADAAVAAGLSAQIALRDAPWQSTGPLRVRMGIHSGDADRRGNDYFGPTVNRAARIMAAGHGGQVLLSRSVATVVDGRLPGGAGMLDLGEHRLKDLTQPERLFQLVHDGLDKDFPPLATLDVRTNNLPIQGSEFFGRQSELAAIEKLLDDPANRLLTLTGPGGTGKTRLSLQLAAERVDRYRDGVYFVDLSDERDPAGVFDAIARTTGVGRKGDGDALQSLIAGLRDSELLVVLDNFEQVTEAAPGIAAVLAACQTIDIVVTSREALQIRAERVFAVPPLSLPARGDARGAVDSEAVQLFMERASAAHPGFTASEEDMAAIVGICVQLDGLPLAIELAAARLSLFSPTELEARLRRRPDVLGSGARDLPARQRTLAGTIAWSHDLLDDDERGLFAVMSVFSTAGLDAVEAIAGDVLDGLAVLDVAGSLITKSLVRRSDDGGSSRLSMLQTIRTYATERLATDPDLAAATRAAHARYYTRFGSDLRQILLGPDREAALEGLEAEIGNLRTAWAHWVDAGELEQLYALLGALWALHDAKGWYHAAIDLATDMLTVLATADPASRDPGEEMTLRASLARALMIVRGYTPEVEEAFKQALELAGEAGGAAHRYPVLRALGSYYTGVADFERCHDIGQELMEIAAEEGDTAIRIDGLLLAGISDAYLGRIGPGLARLDEAARLFDPKIHGPGRFRLGATPGVVVRVASSLTRWQFGELDRAISDNRGALALARDLGHPFSTAYALYHSGFFELQRQRFDVVRDRALELAAVAREHDFAIWQALARVLEGVAESSLGETERGLALTETGVDLYQGLTAPPVFWPLVLCLRAVCLAAADQGAAALDLVDEAIRISGDVERIYPEFRVMRGDLVRLVLPAATGEAEDAYRAAVRGARENGARLVELQALTRLVKLTRDAGDETRLLALYEGFDEGLAEADLVAARALLGLE